jgi:hypothetical protein
VVFDKGPSTTLVICLPMGPECPHEGQISGSTSICVLILKGSFASAPKQPFAGSKAVVQPL